MEMLSDTDLVETLHTTHLPIAHGVVLKDQ